MRITSSLFVVALTLTAESSRLLDNRNGASGAFTGIGRFSLSLNCTAFLIRTPGAGPAYALSAGHCYSLSSQEVFIDRPAQANTRVIFHYFADTIDRQVPVPVRRIAYATMKGRDLALLELASTRAELEARSVRALEIETFEPPDGEPVSIVGAPASYFDAPERFLRQSRCRLGQRADLLEFTWHFWNTRRNDCEDVVGGISGSPIIREQSGRVLGIVNTTTHLAWSSGGDFDCYAGRPCEIGTGRQRVAEETSYSIPVTGVLDCFNPNGEFDLTRPGCPLDRGRQLTVTRRQRNQQPGGNWDATLTGDLPYYRYKTVAAGAADCRDDAGYSPVLRLADRNFIDDPMPLAENRYLLCVVSGPTPAVDSSWQPLADATVVIAGVDRTPPVWQPRYSVFESEDSFRVALVFFPPELSAYDYKFGPPGTTRCDEPGYRPYLRIPLNLPKSEAPYRVCFYAADEADNTSPALDLVLGDGPAILPLGIGSPAGFRPEAFAPGQWISVYGLDLDRAPLRLRDAAGLERPLPAAFTSSTQINALLPPGLAQGQADILIGTRAESIPVVRASPGIFLVTQEPANRLDAFTTGLASVRPADLQARIGRLSLEVAAIERLDNGLERVRLLLPAGHGLRGRQFLQLFSGGLESNRREVWIP